MHQVRHLGHSQSLSGAANLYLCIFRPQLERDEYSYGSKMRLLNSLDLEFREFIDEDTIPDYAILSHTWNEDEVSYHNMTHDREEAHQKKGFAKINKTSELAREHHIQWIWVDTCNIDKTSSAELSEAINCMFKWYSRSSICFVYLSDFEIPKDVEFDFKKMKYVDF